MGRARRRIHAGFQGCRRELREVNAGVVDDANLVVEVPGGLQGVCVADDNQPEQQCRRPDRSVGMAAVIIQG